MPTLCLEYAFLGFGFEGLGDVLFAMADAHLNAELLVDMLCQVLGRVDAAVLAARAAEMR